MLGSAEQNQDRMPEETVIQSSLRDDELKEYLEQVIAEIERQRSLELQSENMIAIVSQELKILILSNIWVWLILISYYKYQVSHTRI